MALDSCNDPRAERAKLRWRWFLRYHAGVPVPSIATCASAWRPTLIFDEATSALEPANTVLICGLPAQLSAAVAVIVASRRSRLRAVATAIVDLKPVIGR